MLLLFCFDLLRFLFLLLQNGWGWVGWSCVFSLDLAISHYGSCSCLLLFYGSEKTIPNMLFVFYCGAFYFESRVYRRAFLPGLREEEGSCKRKETKSKSCPCSSYLSGSRKGLFDCPRLFGTLMAEEVLFLLLSPSFAFAR